MTALLGCALVVAVVAGARGTWSPCGLSMVSAINPLSEAGRGHRYAWTCVWFVVGSVAGGLVLGASAAVLAVALGAVPPTAALGAGAALALVGVASDLRLGGWHLPVHPRQVDEAWFGHYRRWVYAAGFGAQIGLGLATYVMTAATYLLVGLAALTGSPAQALLVGAAFGLVRGGAVLLSAGAADPAALRALHARLEALEPWSLRAAVLTQAAVAAVLAASAWGPPAGAAAAVVAAAAAAGAARASSPASASPPAVTA